ncbi:MAG: 3-dehydroquinate synthase family protein [Acidimicrobiales bacterium]|jgi:5-deoxy-5-amino-3-dehydroquinate synthase
MGDHRLAADAIGQHRTGPKPGRDPLTVRVALAERSYDVLVGPGVRARLAACIPPLARRATVVTQSRIGVEVDPGVAYEVVTIPDGERAKSLATVEDICRFLARTGMHRGDVLVALGGGVVTDVAGYAASSYHRGIALVNVPTTLLGQVDAAIGGKTGVNLPEGKNLVGSFWQPRAVLCDTETLESLPEREWRSGHGEMAKYAFLGVEDLDSLDLCEQVASCVALKAAVVADDEREGGRRAILNYGHTLAHALEAAGLASEDSTSPATQLRHGEAVGIGLVFAAALAHRLGRIDFARVERHRQVVAGYDLPMRLPPGAELSELVGFMARDKKSDGTLTMVLDGPAGVEPVSGVSAELVSEVLEEMGGDR